MALVIPRPFGFIIEEKIRDKLTRTCQSKQLFGSYKEALTAGRKELESRDCPSCACQEIKIFHINALLSVVSESQNTAKGV